MSFMYSWLEKLQVAPTGGGDYESYPALCTEALALFKGEALGNPDIETVIRANHEEFDFDAIIVDEAQDWPQAEADLLGRIYGAERISVADGRDQLVRGSPTNWKLALPKGAPVEDRSLERCLRLKRNLGVFANAVAERAGLNWEVIPNDEAAGGRIILLEGSYGNKTDLQRELVESARKLGNEKIDFLHCVPPSGVVREKDRQSSVLGRQLAANGHEIWDGVDRGTRHDFPRSTDAFRIVQYDSCRGLEGWTTVLEGFDDFWNYKFRSELALLEAGDTTLIRSAADSAKASAWRWAMIALTRPIDTLVIACSETRSEVGQMLWELAKERPDLVETRTDEDRSR